MNQKVVWIGLTYLFSLFLLFKASQAAGRSSWADVVKFSGLFLWMLVLILLVGLSPQIGR